MLDLCAILVNSVFIFCLPFLAVSYYILGSELLTGGVDYYLRCHLQLQGKLQAAL